MFSLFLVTLCFIPYIASSRADAAAAQEFDQEFNQEASTVKIHSILVMGINIPRAGLLKKIHINLRLSLERNISSDILIKEHVIMIGEGWRRLIFPILWESDDSHFTRAG